MSHLYNQDERIRNQQRQQQQQQHPVPIFRVSKRDVFSNEDCEESIGYPFARDDDDQSMFLQQQQLSTLS